MRIGNSIDFHPFKKNRKLILGGIEIPYKKGLDGDSDADALIHSIAEAIFGALAKGDLGTHFKRDESLGMDSKIILLKAKSFLEEEKYKISNIDSMILLEEPKLSPYILPMRENIASILEIDINQVSIKATTMEKEGTIGKKKGCMAYTTVLLEELKWNK